MEGFVPPDGPDDRYDSHKTVMWQTITTVKILTINCAKPKKVFYCWTVCTIWDVVTVTPLYVYWTVHHLDSWIKRDEIDVTCGIISLFNAQHVSDVNTSIFRRLRLICWVISWVVLLWYDVCWCYGVFWLGWCDIRMQAEALVLQPASGLNFMLLIFRIFPWSIPKPSYATGRNFRNEYWILCYWFSEYFHDRFQNLATPLTVHLRQRLLNFMLLIFRVFPWSITKPSYTTGRTEKMSIEFMLLIFRVFPWMIPKLSYSTNLTFQKTCIEFYVTDIQSISMIDYKT